jgi:hypothetical protein
LEKIFEAGNLFALTGWAGLLIALFVPPARKAALAWSGLIVPLLFALAYVPLLATAHAQGSFNSIAGVRSLFQSDQALTAGWFHYLAFDLFVGTWVAREGAERIASPVVRIVLIPVLGLTFMFGPAGFLAFNLLRPLFRRRSAALQGA